MAPTIKREHRIVPRLDQPRGGGGGGGSSRSTQSRNGNVANNGRVYHPIHYLSLMNIADTTFKGNDYKLPDWVFYSSIDIMHYLKCNEVDLRILKAYLKDFMERNDYDGKPFPTTWEEDRDKRHFRALWNRMAAHSEEFDEMLSGARWEAKRRKAAETKRLADEKEERREARREKERQARRAAKARQNAEFEENGRGSPTPSEHKQRVYPTYSRTSPEPTYLEEGICSDFGRSTATPSTGRGSFFSARSSPNASHTSGSNPRSPTYNADSDIEKVDTPSKPNPPVIHLDDLPDIDNPILAVKEEIAEAMNLTGPENVKPFTNFSFIRNKSELIDLTGD
ncbi:hypothetical protein AC579_8120 [Pseudocercospora musae]|uniref:Uncharacterized protein n=1 Tax=Pseudocercospora musae TaxID=113226 RepID=A0A139IG68_9PEZI|nr:hypothetical protein AC579_8120 [Pseudocercospora musae]KXT13681.1 hypothetical protein AC579_8120 [Pseudocercospora musae]KXT13682.1 hypothetical protein AC579_8120 [Pseudocercospora musae]